MNSYTATGQLLGRALAEMGASERTIPYFLVDTCEGEVIERQQVADTTIRAHANRAARWSRIAHEFEYDRRGRIIGAVSINEITGIET